MGRRQQRVEKCERALRCGLQRSRGSGRARRGDQIGWLLHIRVAIASVIRSRDGLADERVDVLEREGDCEGGNQLRAGQRARTSRGRLRRRTDADESDGDEKVAERLARLHLGERELRGRRSLAWRRVWGARSALRSRGATGNGYEGSVRATRATAVLTSGEHVQLSEEVEAKVVRLTVQPHHLCTLARRLYAHTHRYDQLDGYTGHSRPASIDGRHLRIAGGRSGHFYARRSNLRCPRRPRLERRRSESDCAEASVIMLTPAVVSRCCPSRAKRRRRPSRNRMLPYAADDASQVYIQDSPDRANETGRRNRDPNHPASGDALPPDRRRPTLSTRLYRYHPEPRRAADRKGLCQGRLSRVPESTNRSNAHAGMIPRSDLVVLPTRRRRPGQGRASRSLQLLPINYRTDSSTPSRSLSETLGLVSRGLSTVSMTDR